MDLRSLLGDLPEAIQYVVVLGVVMLILYLCLTLTRIIGQNRGKKVTYDDPEAYEKTVPDLFASTFMKRKLKKNAGKNPEDEDEASQQD